MAEATFSFAPASEAEEIAQNIHTILRIRRGTVPYFRSFGVSVTALDMPVVAASRFLASELVAAIQAFEPRASLGQITAEIDLIDGILKNEVKAE